MARGSSSVAYLDRNGQKISGVMWTKLRSNADYILARHYENDKISLRVEWIGKISNSNDMPQEYWKNFVVLVGNVIITGDRPGTYGKKVVSDPTLTRNFATEGLAMQYYEQFLTEKGLISVEESYEGELTITEHGNIHFNDVALGKASLGTPMKESEEYLTRKEKPTSTNAKFGSW